MTLRSCWLSRAGSRGDNQDLLLEPVSTGLDWWCAIADGVGTSHHGARASRFCIDAIRKTMQDELAMDTLFRAVSAYMIRRAAEIGVTDSMSTTLSVLRLSRCTAFVGHVGDTRITHYRGNGVMTRTHDQTEVQRLVDTGVLSRYQARRYPRKNVLISAMSTHSEYDLYESAFGVHVGDRILLTTDGFHQIVDRREIALLSSRHASLDLFFEGIKDSLSRRSLADDATCLAVEVE